MAFPAGYKYTKERTSGSELSTAPPAASASPTTRRHSLGDIVFVELPKVGDKLEAAQAIFGSVESSQSCFSDLYAPVSGTVTEINDALTAPHPRPSTPTPTTTWI